MVVFIFKSICLFISVVQTCCGELGCSPGVARGLSRWGLLLLLSSGSGAWISVVAACGLSRCGSWAPELRLPIVVAWGLICSVACGIFLGQGPNPCLLRCQADSLPLNHQGSPLLYNCF